MFEGPEKKIELILKTPLSGLRDNTDGKWDRVVTSARAEILHKISTSALDAYLLSESSLFVWDDRILMITCGRTVLSHALPEMLRFIARERIAFLFYEQKNFLFPESQPATFSRDAALLHDHFPGHAIRIGPPGGDHIHLFYGDTSHSPIPGDATLQVLMHDIAPEAALAFQDDKHRCVRDIPAATGLDQLFSGADMKMDGHLFDPCGYSLNAVKGDRYFTVHATPQTEGSYVSFETNMAGAGLRDAARRDTVERLTRIFTPRRFTLMITADIFDEPENKGRQGTDQTAPPPPGYAVTHAWQRKLDCGYEIRFFNFSRREKNP